MLIFLCQYNEQFENGLFSQFLDEQSTFADSNLIDANVWNSSNFILQSIIHSDLYKTHNFFSKHLIYRLSSSLSTLFPLFSCQ